MNASRHIKLVHEGQYIAQVEVQLNGAEEPWGPYLSLDDASKLDEVREAHSRGDIPAAAAKARIFRMIPMSAA